MAEQNWWDAYPDAPAQSGPLPSPPKKVAPAKPPTAFEIEDQEIKRKKAEREEREWKATHNADGSKKTPDQMPQAYSQSAMDSFDRALNSIETLKKHPGMRAAVGSGFDPAAIGSFNPLTSAGRSGIPMAGTAAAGFVARLNALKAQVFLPMVQSMKGMGALSNAEGDKLTAAIGALDSSMPETDFIASMNEVKADLTRYRERAAGRSGKTRPAAPANKGGWGKARVVE